MASCPVLWVTEVRNRVFHTGCFFLHGSTFARVQPGLRRELKILYYISKLRYHGGNTVPYRNVHFNTLHTVRIEGSHKSHKMYKDQYGGSSKHVVVASPNCTELVVPYHFVPYSRIVGGQSIVPYRTVRRHQIRRSPEISAISLYRVA